jgi:hypothetical protein
MENMLGHLDQKGIIDIIVPAKITFAGNEELSIYKTVICKAENRCNSTKNNIYNKFI